MKYFISSFLLISSCLLFTFVTCLIFASATPNNNNKNSLFVPKPKLHLTPNPRPKNGWVKQLKELPGYRGPNGERVPPTYPIFSGMVEITELEGVDGVIKMFMHYMVFGNKYDERDEVINFYPGGPGVGMISSAFMEGLGGTWLNAHSYTTETYAATGIPSPLDNPYSLNGLGVVIGLDNPPPTGYSYCINQNSSNSGPSGDGYSCGHWNDTKTGIAQAQAFNVILTDHFPNLLKINATATGKPRNIYNFAESYGGVYAAATAQYIFTRPEYSLLASRFAMIANGDACMGTDQICGSTTTWFAGGEIPWYFLSFMRGHFQIPFDLWNDLLATCGEARLRTQIPSTYSGACLQSYNTVVKAAGKNFFEYYLYSTCTQNIFSSSEVKKYNLRPEHGGVTKRRPAGVASLLRQFSPVVPASSTASQQQQQINEELNVDGYVCASDSLNVYLNHPIVKLALGVPSDMRYFVADDSHGLFYTWTMQDSFKIWSDILNVQNGKQAKYFNVLPRPSSSPKVRVRAYEGDSDPGVIITKVEEKWYEFAKNMSYSKTQEWTNWFLADPMRDPSNPYSQVAGGYKVEWGPNSELSFYTVRGSGHMVPQIRSHSFLGMAEQMIYNSAMNSSMVDRFVQP